MSSLPVVISSTRRAAAALACACALLSGCRGPATDALMATALAAGDNVLPDNGGDDLPDSSQTIDATGSSITSPDWLHLEMGRLVQLCGGPIIFTTPPAITIRGLSPC